MVDKEERARRTEKKQREQSLLSVGTDRCLVDADVYVPFGSLMTPPPLTPHKVTSAKTMRDNCAHIVIKLFA